MVILMFILCVRNGQGTPCRALDVPEPPAVLGPEEPGREAELV